MIRRITFFLFIFLAGSALAQQNKRGTILLKKSSCEKRSGGRSVFKKVDSMPQFPGGDDAGNLWVRRNLIYPEVALSSGLEGVVNVSFVVMPDGSLKDIVIRSISDPVFGEEALRLLRKMPRWKQGMCGGEAVAVEMYLPVKFSITRRTPVYSID